jgi:hypothetical protein
MTRYLAPVLAAGLVAALGTPLPGQTPPTRPPHRALDEARRAGWELALLVVQKLEAGDSKPFPGIAAWLKDLRKATAGMDLKAAPAEWPPLDVDALVTRNPKFWQAYYEIAPADPGLMLLHAGLLLSAGEANRASYLITVAAQRPGVPKAVRQGFEILLGHAQKVAQRPEALVRQGIRLHDRGDYDGALKKYREALALWPGYGFAHYETGLSRFVRDLVAAGEKPPPPGSVLVNGGRKLSHEVAAAYGRARRHDPLQVNAYQGDDPQVIRGLLALVKKGMPAWEKLVKARGERVPDSVLQDLAAAFQEADIHELALAVRQVLAARRGRYAPADHPFITTSLRKVAPGQPTEEVLKQLGGGELKVRQLIAPEAAPAGEPKAVELSQLRLYVPNAEMPKRVGDDVKPLVNYIKALEKAAADGLAGEKLPRAKGLLIAVGIKPGKKSRVWCESVEGEIPDPILRKLEKELAKVEAIPVKNGAMAFGMEVRLNGQRVRRFPEFPAAWREAARRSGTKLLVPPDELFKVIWPD